MKKFLLLVLLPLTTAAVFGQHYFQYDDNNTSSSLYEDANGLVGIGYAGADSRLHVFAGCDEQSVIMATIVPPSGDVCSTSLGDYFIANNVQLTSPEPTVRTDFIIKDGGQVGIGTATPVSDLTIHAHGYGTDDWGNTVFYVEDDHSNNHNLIAALLNTGTTDYASGAFLVNAYKDAVVPGLGLVDGENQILAFGARGDGTIAMGWDVSTSFDPDAQLTLRAYDPNSIHDYIFSIMNASSIPLLQIRYNGKIGMGMTPSTSSTLRLYDTDGDTRIDLVPRSNHKSEIRFMDDGSAQARHVISDDNGDLLLDPKVSGAQGGNDRVKVAGDEYVTGKLGVGINVPTSISSAVAIKGSGSSNLDLFETSTTSFNASFRFVNSSGTVKHIITDAADKLVIMPRIDAGANDVATVAIAGNEEVTSSVSIGTGITAPSILNSTLALQRPYVSGNPGGPSLDFFQEDEVSGWNAQIRFGRHYNDGQEQCALRHIIADNYQTGDLDITPGVDLNSSHIGNTNLTNVVRVRGKLVVGDHKISSGTHADALLCVDGKIAAKYCVVTINNWADEVFNNDYKLRTIPELENYIAENKHLPEVPTECEVKDAGISLGEMNTTLLKKIEELTLYTIQQQKEIEELRKNVSALNNK